MEGMMYTEVEEYIAENETDFISFKSSVVLKDAQNDPIKRTAAITDVVKSIAIIPDEITRMVYAKECSSRFGIDEQTILRQIKHHRNKFIDQWHKERQQQQAREQRMSANSEHSPAATDDASVPPPPVPEIENYAPTRTETTSGPTTVNASSDLSLQEREVVRLIVNYGMCYLTDTEYEDGQLRPTTVLEYIGNELFLDQMQFSNPLYNRTYETAKRYLEPYYRDLKVLTDELDKRVSDIIESEMSKNDEAPEALDSTALISAQERKRKTAEAKANVMAKNELQEFSSDYLLKALCSIDDDEVRQLACDLAADNLPQLSKIHTQFAVILEDKDRLRNLVPDRLYNWKNAILIQRINETKDKIAHADADQQPKLMEYLQELYNLRHRIARKIGDRVVNPK